MNLAPPHIELELKLRVPPAAVRRLSGHRLLKGSAPASKRRLYGIYYDTPGLDLWRQGIALRLRREGGRWFQAVKSGGAALAGLHRRLEDEVEVAGPAPDFSRITQDGLAAAFSPERLRARLKPVFVTDFVRSSRLLELDPQTRVEASIDRGMIRSGGRSEPVSELELELKTGAPQRLYEMALTLVKDLPLSIENRSKAERGYALHRGKGPKPARAHHPALTPALSVGESFKAIVRANLAQLQANERGMLEDADPEYLHQMRVALRRLRSAFNVFEPVIPEAVVAPLTAELKWLAGRLGPARDWDVFVTETLPPIEKEFGAHGELRVFCKHCCKLRDGACARARRVVRGARYGRLMLSLGSWLAAGDWPAGLEADRRAVLDTPVGGFAGTVLEKRYDQVRRRGRKVGTLSAKQLHRLRIAVKKYRYAADFFAGLYEGAPVREALKRLSRLQDVLGAINDAATVTNLITLGFEGTRGRRMPEARGILLGWSRGHAVTLRRDLKSAWKPFRAARRFWR